MNRNEVIKYPILSEKTYVQMANNVFTFAVDFRTNKAEVKKTIEFIFGVKVAKVNIATVGKKATKLGRYAGFTNRFKKAIVTISEGTINLFPAEAAPAPKKETKEVNNEPSEAELKAAAKIAAKTKEAETEVKETKKAEPTKAEAKVEETKKETPVKAEK